MTHDMPETIYVFSDHRSIGDLGFTRTDKQDDHTQYTRSDLAVPIDRHEALVTKCAIYEDALTEIAAHMGHLGHIAEIALNQAKQRIK